MTKSRVALRRMAVCSPLFFPKAASVFYSFELNCDPALPGDTRGWSRSTRGASWKGCASPPLSRNVPMRQEGGSDQAAKSQEPPLPRVAPAASPLSHGLVTPVLTPFFCFREFRCQIGYNSYIN